MRWHVREAGQGEPALVLLHGGGADSGDISYGAVVPRLARDRRVIVPDLPGFGETPGDVATTTFEAYIDAVLALVAALGLMHADLGGLSLGGGIALGAALRRPAWLRRLVLVAPYGLTRRIPYAGLTRWLVGHPGLSAALTNLSVSRPAWARRALQAIVVNRAALTPELVAAVMAEARRPGGGAAWLALQGSEVTPAGLRTCYADQLGEVAARTLILIGERDRLVAVADCRRAAAAIPRACLQVLPGCGHWVPRDQPDAFTSALQAFLASGGERA